MAEGKAAGSIVPFSQFIEKHRRGALNDEITAALADCVTATQEVGDPKKPGKVVITLQVNSNGPDSPTIIFVDSVKVTNPEHARESSVYYVDGVTGNLNRTDPLSGFQQQEFKDGNRGE